MKTLFVNHHHLDSNSGVHIFNLANQLTRLGVECVVCVPEQKEAVKALGKPTFEVIDFEDFHRIKKKWKIDIIHAWTPRESVRLMTNKLIAIFECPYIVHLEDNEEALISAAFDKPIASLKKFSTEKLDEIIPPHMTHPIRYKGFLESASGITIIINALEEFIPSEVPRVVIWPGYEEAMNWGFPQNTTFRQHLGIDPEEYVVVYTGNVHPANRKEVSSLYLAVGMLNRLGIRTRIVRTGQDFVPLVEKQLEKIKDYCINLGYIERSKLPMVLSIADVLVQPGKADDFNNYRFPSKIPEYLATGKPVVLPATNIGRYVKDGEECVLLTEGHALDIANQLERLFNDQELRKRIGEGGRRFAENNLRWAGSAEKLLGFYHRVLDNNKRGVFLSKNSRQKIHDANPMENSKKGIKEEAKLRTKVKALPFLSYGTVKDYCEGADRFPQIMHFDGDLKDLQRPWMVKSISQMIPRGARLLEIGGGEPLVAGLLQKCGYEVTIIDPYDGTGNGPLDYERYRKDFPEIKFIKSYFDRNLQDLLPRSYECIYSVSVLEHVPQLKLQDIFAGISKYLMPGGCSIHCVDLVIAGRMAEWHEKSAREILFYQRQLQNPNLDGSQITKQIDSLMPKYYQEITDDLDTYYLSAQGFNLWRGKRPYDECSFQKIISMQTCAFIFI